MNRRNIRKLRYEKEEQVGSCLIRSEKVMDEQKLGDLLITTMKRWHLGRLLKARLDAGRGGCRGPIMCIRTVSKACRKDGMGKSCMT